MRPDRIDREESVLVDVIHCVTDESLLDVHLTARTIDVSPCGMKMTMSMDVPRETHLGLRLDFDNQIYRLEGDVRWVQRETDCSVGVELDPDSADIEQWAQLFSQLSTANTAEFFLPA